MCSKSAFLRPRRFPQTIFLVIRRLCADNVHTQHTLSRLDAYYVHTYFEKCASGALCTLGQSGMHTWHTLALVCKVCSMFQTLSGKSSKTPSNPTPMHRDTQGIPVSSRSCASWIAASTSMLALKMLPPNDAWLALHGQHAVAVLVAVLVAVHCVLVALLSERQRAD